MGWEPKWESAMENCTHAGPWGWKGWRLQEWKEVHAPFAVRRFRYFRVGRPGEAHGPARGANQNSLAAAFRYILCQPETREGRMSPESSQKVWIPVCWGRVM